MDVLQQIPGISFFDHFLSFCDITIYNYTYFYFPYATFDNLFRRRFVARKPERGAPVLEPSAQVEGPNHFAISAYGPPGV
jgi:hypothetical protein